MYEEFQRALQELAPKRFKGQSKEEALQSIFRLVEGKEPTNAGVTVSPKFQFAQKVAAIDLSRGTQIHNPEQNLSVLNFWLNLCEAGPSQSPEGQGGSSLT